jgi:hypothetical protein
MADQRLGNVEGFHQVADAQFLLGEQRQDLSPQRVGHRP